MFENQVKEYKNLVLNLVPSQDKITIDSLSGIVNFPKSLLRYLTSYISLNLSKDIDNLFNLDEFDFSDDFTQNKIEYLLEVAKYYKIQKNDLEEILASAIDIRFNYLIRPQITLTTLIHDSGLLTKDNRIFARFLFDEYNYLLNDIELETLSKNEFIEQIGKADTNYMYDLEPAKFVKLLMSIFELFQFDGLKPENNQVPIESLLVFFDEKGIAPLVEKLANFANDEGKENISRKEIIDLIQKISGIENIELEQQTPEINEEINMPNTNLKNKIIELIESDFTSDDLKTDDFVFTKIDNPIQQITQFVENDDYVMPETTEAPVVTEPVSTNSNNFEFNPEPSISDNIDEEIHNLKTQFDHLANYELPEILMTEANSSFQKKIEALTGDLG